MVKIRLTLEALRQRYPLTMEGAKKIHVGQNMLGIADRYIFEVNYKDGNRLMFSFSTPQQFYKCIDKLEASRV